MKLRKKIRLRRRIAGAIILCLPTLWVVVTDMLRRARLIAAFDKPHLTGYCASAIESLIFWSVLLHVASRRRGVVRAVAAGLFFVFFTLAAGIEGAFHAFYNIYLSMDGQIHSKSLPWSIVGTLPLYRPIVIAHIALAAGIALLLLRAGRRFVRPRLWPWRIAALIVPFGIFAVFRVPVSYRTLQSTPFDM